MNHPTSAKTSPPAWMASCRGSSCASCCAGSITMPRCSRLVALSRRPRRSAPAAAAVGIDRICRAGDAGDRAGVGASGRTVRRSHWLRWSGRWRDRRQRGRCGADDRQPAGGRRPGDGTTASATAHGASCRSDARPAVPRRPPPVPPWLSGNSAATAEPAGVGHAGCAIRQQPACCTRATACRPIQPMHRYRTLDNNDGSYLLLLDPGNRRCRYARAGCRRRAISEVARDCPTAAAQLVSLPSTVLLCGSAVSDSPGRADEVIHEPEALPAEVNQGGVMNHSILRTWRVVPCWAWPASAACRPRRRPCASLPDFTGIVQKNAAAVVHVEAKYNGEKQARASSQAAAERMPGQGMPTIRRRRCSGASSACR